MRLAYPGNHTGLPLRFGCLLGFMGISVRPRKAGFPLRYNIDDLGGKIFDCGYRSGGGPLIPSNKRWSIFAWYLGYEGEASRAKWVRKCSIEVRKAEDAP